MRQADAGGTGRSRRRALRGMSAMRRRGRRDARRGRRESGRVDIVDAAGRAGRGLTQPRLSAMLIARPVRRNPVELEELSRSDSVYGHTHRPGDREHGRARSPVGNADEKARLPAPRGRNAAYRKYRRSLVRSPCGQAAAQPSATHYFLDRTGFPGGRHRRVGPDRNARRKLPGSLAVPLSGAARP